MLSLIYEGSDCTSGCRTTSRYSEVCSVGQKQTEMMYVNDVRSVGQIQTETM